MVFVAPNKPSGIRTIDYVRDGRGLYSGKTAAELAQQYGGEVTEMTEDDAHELNRRSFQSEPVQITAADWDWLFECLPPARYRELPGRVSIFHVIERVYGDIVTWCVRRGAEHWKLNAPEATPHAEILARLPA